MYLSVFTHSSVGGHLDCFHVLVTVNSAAVNTGVHASFQNMVFSIYMPRSGTAGSYASSIFSFLKKLHTVFSVVALCQHYKRVPFFSHPL